jgi:hypothetical protein
MPTPQQYGNFNSFRKRKRFLGATAVYCNEWPDTKEKAKGNKTQNKETALLLSVKMPCASLEFEKKEYIQKYVQRIL